MAVLPVPEIRRTLAALGFPSDLNTAIKIRHAARHGNLTMTEDRIYGLNLKLEKT